MEIISTQTVFLVIDRRVTDIFFLSENQQIQQSNNKRDTLKTLSTFMLFKEIFKMFLGLVVFLFQSFACSIFYFYDVLASFVVTRRFLIFIRAKQRLLFK